MMDFVKFLITDGKDRIWTLWEKRTPGDWTPLEMEKKYMDQSNLVSDIGSAVVIKEVHILPDNDVFFGYQTICDIEDLNDPEPYIAYRKLSEVQLAYNPSVEKEFWEG